MTPFQKSVKQALANQTNIHPDTVVAHKNDTLSAKHSYFYTHGNTAEKWAAKVAAELAAAGINAHVYGRDDFASWPKTSYFVAVISEAF